MNMFGKLGEFIIAYQEEVQLIFIIALVAAAIFIIGRIVRANRKKGQILTQISDTVTQINTTVTSINDKQSGVVYIDNRVGAEADAKALRTAVSEAAEQAKQAGAAMQGEADAIKGRPSDAAGDAEAAAVETVSDHEADKADGAAEQKASETTGQPDESGQPEQPDQSGQAGETETAEGSEGSERPEENAAQAVRKYFSRNCAVSKTGRSYTIEELNDQIRE